MSKNVARQAVRTLCRCNAKVNDIRAQHSSECHSFRTFYQANGCEHATEDDTERGEAPDIVLPHQEAEFVRHIAMDIGGSLIKLVYFSPEEDDESSDAIESDASSGNQTPSPGSGRESSQGGSKFSRTLAQFEQSPAAQDIVASAFADTPMRPAEPSYSAAHPIDPAAEPLGEHAPGDGPARDALEAGRRPTSAHNAAPATPPQPPKTLDAHNSQADQASNQTLPSRLSQQSLGVASEKAARGGRLHFVKFETRNIEDAIRFIEQKQLLRNRSNNGQAVAPLQARPPRFIARQLCHLSPGQGATTTSPQPSNT